MLLDDRAGVFGGEWAVMDAIAGDLFLDFGLNLVAQSLGEPGPVEESGALCGLEYHCDWASCAMIEAACGFELDLVAARLGDRIFKCGIHCFTPAIPTTTAIGIAGRSALGADKNPVLAGWHGVTGDCSWFGFRMPELGEIMGLRGLAKNPGLAVWVVLD
jgi:hypothetical protein